MLGKYIENLKIFNVAPREGSAQQKKKKSKKELEETEILLKCDPALLCLEVSYLKNNKNVVTHTKIKITHPKKVSHLVSKKVKGHFSFDEIKNKMMSEIGKLQRKISDIKEDSKEELKKARQKKRTTRRTVKNTKFTKK
ncbi:MAG: hypothetical protein GY909_15230 [Oligoflexia bacterium]|nr:hypothetical protein [Oligoflexia bacterium]